MNIFKLLVVLILLLLTFVIFPFSTYSVEENPCLTCHVKFKEPVYSVHKALAMGCEPCHKAIEGKKHPEQKDSMKLAQDMPGLCYGCHDGSKFKGKSVHAPVAGGMCTSCHNAHGSNFAKILKSDRPGLCFNCHDESKFKGKSVHAPVANGMCTSCHNAHSSNFNSMLANDLPDLCYMCHEKANFTKKYVHRAITVVGCGSCHSHHVSNYPLLLPKAINDVCITCHKPQASGKHVVSLPGKKVHPLKGVTDPSTTTFTTVAEPEKRIVRFVPDPKNPGREMSCVSCHNPHSSDFNRLFPSAEICHKCHKEY